MLTHVGLNAVATAEDFVGLSFRPVILLPADYEVYDFSQGYDPARPRTSEFGVGRYNERRPGMYTSSLFAGAEPRNIHIGVDLAAPVGTPVHLFYSGTIYMAAINPAEGDYGGTVITEHQIGERRLWALHGHLSHSSVVSRGIGEKLIAGEVLGWVGNKAENGGWNPHVHFQLSWLRPEQCDMPGAVSESGLAQALQHYPDPRLVLGPIY